MRIRRNKKVKTESDPLELLDEEALDDERDARTSPARRTISFRCCYG